MSNEFNDENNSTMMIDNSHPSLSHLPTELIFHIIHRLPQSPYYKCLNICRRLNAIESQYRPERTALCICRLHKCSPNLPSEELKLRICTHTGQGRLETLAMMIKKQPITCKIEIAGKRSRVEHLQAYLTQYVDHPNIQMFLENWETKVVCRPQDDLFNKSIDLFKEGKNRFDTEFTTFHLCLTLGEDPDLNKRFCRILPGSCFANVRISCNSTSFHFLNHYLKTYCHIFDVLDFQKKVTALNIEYIAFNRIHLDSLNGFSNISELTLTINDLDFEEFKNRILELTDFLQQAKLKQLYTFKLLENSTFGYRPELISVWLNFLAVIPSKNLQRFEIINRTDQYSNQFSDSFSSFAHQIIPFKRLQFLTINHKSFGAILVNMLLPSRRLNKLDLRMNFDISNKTEIDRLCQNIENCNDLEEITIQLPTEASIVFENIFLSLGKLSRLIRMNLYLNSFEGIQTDDCFQNLTEMKTLRIMRIYITETTLFGSNISRETCSKFKTTIKKLVPKSCHILVGESR